MTLHTGMTEIEFIEEIDPCLNFDADEEYENAARIACSISDNAALMVGFVLATLSSYASLDVNMRLLKIMKDERPTPIILAALPVIELLLKNKKVPAEDARRLLDACQQHDNAWNGLGIVECADEKLGGKCEEIREIWRKAGS